MRLCHWSILLAILAVGASPSFAGLVTNGTFDNNCAGWTLVNTDANWCSGTEGNPGGALILNNSPGVSPQASQTIAGLVVGDVYQLTLDAKTHYNCCNSAYGGQGVAAGIDGQVFDIAIYDSQPWTTYTFSFTYGGGDNTLWIATQRTGTDADGEFDNVDITGGSASVPEPATLSVFLGGALVLAGMRLRRR